MKHIFVVDDEANIRELIKKYLDKEGYKSTLFSNGDNLLMEVKRLKPDLLVLDIMMPGADGFQLCKDIRKESEIPIIFVSARDEEFDRILGLELGGDDYLSKPFSPRELTARIKNVFKRINKAQLCSQETIIIQDLTIDINKKCVEKDSNEIRLTIKEYELLEFLAKNRKMTLSREQLTENIWGYDFLGDSRVIDDLVKRIRKKLREHSSQVEITTVWGYGYRLDEKDK